MDLGATPIFEISVKNCKSEPELKFEVENRKLILPQRTCGDFSPIIERVLAGVNYVLKQSLFFSRRSMEQL